MRSAVPCEAGTDSAVGPQSPKSAIRTRAVAARDLAEAGGQSEIGTLHLVKALLDQPGGVVPQLAERMGVGRAALDPVIGRNEEIRRVIQILARRTKNNPVLIGEPDLGKTAIVEGLAQWWASWACQRIDHVERWCGEFTPAV